MASSKDFELLEFPLYQRHKKISHPHHENKSLLLLLSCFFIINKTYFYSRWIQLLVEIHIYLFELLNHGSWAIARTKRRQVLLLVFDFKIALINVIVVFKFSYEKPSSAHTATLYYFAGRGLADQIRWMLAAANIEFTQKVILLAPCILKRVICC